MSGTQQQESGFTIVEFMVSIVVFPLLFLTVAYAYDAISKSYNLSKQFNETYAVLSACPEIDRALQYDALSTGTNCYPNNSFKAEGGSGNTITYTPSLTVTNTPNLPNSDPLSTIPDSKVVNIDVGFPNSNAPNLQLRMLITRNGIGQL